MNGEEDHEHHAGDQGKENIDSGEATGLAGIRQRPQEPGEPWSQQNEAEAVEGDTSERLVSGQDDDRERDPDDAEGHIHPEHPRPMQVLENRAADDGPEDRAENRRKAHHRHDLPDVPPVCRLHDDGGHERQHDSPAQALDHAEGDETAGTPGETGQNRAHQEHGQCDDPQTFAAEAPLRPPRHRNGDAECEKVPGGHPLDGRKSGMEFAGQGAKAHGGDRRVEEHGQRTDEHRAGCPPDVWVDSGRGSLSSGHRGTPEEF